jgi:anti-sigma B factor antagonist
MSTGDFRAEATAIGPATMISWHGELDLLAAPTIHAGIERVLGARPPVLAIDLRGLTFMNSTGLHTVIETQRRCHQQGIRFLLIRGGEVIDRLLRLCGLDRHFEFVASPDQLTVPLPAS